MFDIGVLELFMLVVVAIVVVGPKDLPKMMRTVGRAVGKMRALAGEFRSSLDELAREAEMEELRENMPSIDPGSITESLEKAIDPTGTFDSAGQPQAPSAKTGDKQPAKDEAP